MDGKGNWANEDIHKGEIVFKGPFEETLIHVEEYDRYPEWKKQYVDHFAERAHDEVYSISSRAQEDIRFGPISDLPCTKLRMVYSYFTNHACLPNIKYDDTYDQMVAIRDITAGEEL
jgi:hypothetical protein